MQQNIKINNIITYLSMGSILFIVAFSYFQFLEYQHYTERVEHTYEVFYKIEKLRAAISNEMAFRRGYIFSPSEELRETIQNERQTVFKILDTLGVLLSDNFPQVKNVQQLHDLLQNPDLPTNRFNTYPHPATESEMLIDDVQNGKHLYENVFREIDQVQKNEAQLFKTRSESQHEFGESIPFLFLFSGVGSVVLLAFAFFQAKEELRFHLETQKILQQKVDELNKSNAELERFAFIASHNLQEPLRKTQTFISKILDKNLPPDEARPLLQKSQRTVSKLQDLLDNLHFYTSLLSNNFERLPVDLNKCLAEAKQEFSAEIEKSGCHFRVEKLPEVLGVPSQIEMVFQQLISNSLKFHKPGEKPEIEVSARFSKPEKMWVITFSDHGIGFDGQFKDKVFEVFSSLHPADEFPGTGIGLTICQRIMTQHNGYIRAQSVENQGATFELGFPKPTI